MYTPFRIVLIPLLAAGLGIRAHGADIGNTTGASDGTRVEIELADGSLISGSVEESTVVVQLPFEPLKIPIAQIVLIHFDRKDRVVRLEMANGDRLRGTWLAPMPLHLSSPILGTVAIAPEQISRIRRIPRTAQALELVASVPLSGATGVDALLPLRNRTDTVLAVTQNVGADCGGGTPATVWRLVYKAGPEPRVQVESVQQLDQIQQVRSAMLESTDGTLFTGGGWCGAKPPYYSSDEGATWQPATTGTHPPNSTFCYGELKGQVFAGTGYEPHHGQVYRWLGEGAWELVFDVAPPRSILTRMATFNDCLFVGSQIYWSGGTRGVAPVFSSTDGKAFRATEGIPDTDNIFQLLVSRDQLFAFASGPAGRTLYRWADERWKAWGEWPAIDVPPVASGRGNWFACGKLNGDATLGLYRSDDLGRTWQRLLAIDLPGVRCMAMQDHWIYLGGISDGASNGNARVLRIAVDP